MQKRNWDLVHKFEDKYKKSFLRNLTIKDSLAVFLDLYQFSYRLVNKKKVFGFNTDKMEALCKIHSIFNKVKL